MTCHYLIENRNTCLKHSGEQVPETLARPGETMALMAL